MSRTLHFCIGVGLRHCDAGRSRNALTAESRPGSSQVHCGPMPPAAPPWPCVFPAHSLLGATLVGGGVPALLPRAF